MSNFDTDDCACERRLDTYFRNIVIPDTEFLDDALHSINQQLSFRRQFLKHLNLKQVCNSDCFTMKQRVNVTIDALERMQKFVIYYVGRTSSVQGLPQILRELLTERIAA